MALADSKTMKAMVEFREQTGKTQLLLLALYPDYFYLLRKHLSQKKKKKSVGVFRCFGVMLSVVNRSKTV